MEQDAVKEYGMVMNEGILTLSIIGEIEGHDCLPATTKTTKYEHVLPKLAELEDNPDTEGKLLLLSERRGCAVQR